MGGREQGPYVAVAWEVLADRQDRMVVGARLASEVLQQLDLTQSALGQDFLAENIGDLLDGDALARLVVGGRAAGT